MFRFADMREEGIREKLGHDADCRRHLDYLYDICDGEVAIDESTGKLAGYVFVKQYEEPGFIFNLFVDETYRNQGIGSRLLDDAVKKYNGYDLLVDVENNVAIRMYEKHGFNVVGVVDEQYYMRRGGEVDDCEVPDD